MREKVGNKESICLGDLKVGEAVIAEMHDHLWYIYPRPGEPELPAS